MHELGDYLPHLGDYWPAESSRIDIRMMISLKLNAPGMQLYTSGDVCQYIYIYCHVNVDLLLNSILMYTYILN